MYWSFPSRHAQGYKNELNHFIDVVQGQENLSNYFWYEEEDMQEKMIFLNNSGDIEDLT